MEPGLGIYLLSLAPTAGLEPATSKLTASCSTIELRRNTLVIIRNDTPFVNLFGQSYRGYVRETQAFLLRLLHSLILLVAYGIRKVESK